jgi:hypothetical protein
MVINGQLHTNIGQQSKLENKEKCFIRDFLHLSTFFFIIFRKSEILLNEMPIIYKISLHWLAMHIEVKFEKYPF